MKILSIKFQNLNSIKGESTIDFREPPLANVGLFAITGDTGAGKTTILDALTLGLYGRIHRNKQEEEIMTYGEGECRADVIFESKRGQFLSQWMLRRAKQKADGKFQPSKRSISKWDEKKEEWVILAAEKKRAVDEQVELAIGLDYNRFCRSVLLSQGDFAAFLKSNEKERSDLLERITGTEIYSQISIAAFDKNKIEREKLEQFQQRLDVLQIMDKAAEKELQTEQKTNQKEAKNLEQNIKNLRDQFDIISQLEKAQQTLITLEQQQKAWLVKKETAAEDLKKLAVYAKTQPFSSLITQQDQASQQFEELTNTCTILQTKIPQLQGALTDISTADISKSKELTELQTHFDKEKPLWEKVEKLDVELEKKASIFQRTQDNLQSIQSDQKTTQSSITDRQNKLKESTEKLKLNTNWLKKNKALSTLAMDYPILDRLKTDLRRLYKEKQEQTRLLETNQSAKNTQAEKLAALKKSFVLQEKQFEKSQEQFEKETGLSFSAESTQITNEIQTSIDRLQEEIIQLKEMLSFAEQYKVMVAEFNEREDEFNNLLHKETALNKDLLSLMEMLDQLIEKRTYKQHIFEQQQLFANYEKDRSELKEGEECPLCYSTEHPFREHPIKTFVSEARTELEQINDQVEPIQKEYQKRLRQCEETILAMEHFQPKENSKEKIIGMEAKMAQMEIKSQNGSFAETTPPILIEKINAKENQLKVKKVIQSLAGKMSQALHQQATQIQALQQQIEIEQANLNNLTAQIDPTTAKNIQLTEAYHNHILEINEKLEKYKLTFQLETAKEMFATLDQYNSEFNTHHIHQEQINKEITRINDQIIGQNSEQKKINLKEKEAHKVFLKEQKELQELTKTRNTLFADKNPKSIREALQEQIDALRLSHQEIIQIKTQKNEQVKAQKAILKDKGIQLKKVSDALKATQSKIQSNLKKHHFESIEEVLALALSVEEHQTILTLKERLQEEETLFIRNATEAKSQIKEATKKRTDQRSLDFIQKNLHEQEGQMTDIHQHLGGINERLTESNRKKDQAKTLLKDIKNQTKECKRWSQLNEIIGQADGKKFRIFAQGLTLQQLVHLANNHLHTLQERYVILKPETENLSLSIIDTYHADNQRSMNTLSGGESFLVSLALALGLSDLAGQNTQIESLFIDEGFGSLDDNTLDLAVSTLENLKSTGKSIGIISHVASLKERMNTQIRVEKGGNGFSSVRVGN